MKQFCRSDNFEVYAVCYAICILFQKNIYWIFNQQIAEKSIQFPMDKFQKYIQFPWNNFQKKIHCISRKLRGGFLERVLTGNKTWEQDLKTRAWDGLTSINYRKLSLLSVLSGYDGSESLSIGQRTRSWLFGAYHTHATLQGLQGYSKDNTCQTYKEHETCIHLIHVGGGGSYTNFLAKVKSRILLTLSMLDIRWKPVQY